MSLKWDPYGRDNSSSSSRDRLETKHGRSVDLLAKYLRDVVLQKIDANLRDKCLPTDERLQSFVQRLVGLLQKQLKKAPKKDRQMLQALITSRFQKVWDFQRNQMVRPTTPEDIKLAVQSLVENLISDFTVSSESLLLAQPKPVHYHTSAQLLRNSGTESACASI